jgi:hypothetical protein
MEDFIVEDRILTVDAAVKDIISRLEESSKNNIKSVLREHELYLYHHGFGTHIRNYYKLWDKKTELLVDCKRVAIERGMKLTPLETDDFVIHPDDASHVIIVSLWETLRK